MAFSIRVEISHESMIEVVKLQLDKAINELEQEGSFVLLSKRWDVDTLSIEFKKALWSFAGKCEVTDTQVLVTADDIPGGLFFLKGRIERELHDGIKKRIT